MLALAVSGDTSLPRMLSRFAELAQALGGEPARQQGQLAAAEEAVRSAASPLKVLALSAAGSGQVHLARPRAWPELRHLAELGVELADHGAGGVNWSTTDWEHAAALAPDLVLADSRGKRRPGKGVGLRPRLARSHRDRHRGALESRTAVQRRGLCGLPALGRGRAGGAARQAVSGRGRTSRMTSVIRE